MSRYNEVGKHHTSIRSEGDEIIVRYHKTDVVRFDTRTRIVKLFSGGWQTNTTKLRMNQFSQQYCDGKFGVWQEDRVWFVSFPDNHVEGFKDGMEIQL